MATSEFGICQQKDQISRMPVDCFEIFRVNMQEYKDRGKVASPDREWLRDRKRQREKERVKDREGETVKQRERGWETEKKKKEKNNQFERERYAMSNFIILINVFIINLTLTKQSW